MMPRFRPCLLPGAALALVLSPGPSLHAQDHGRDGEPVIASIDPARLGYDLLVDATLPADDPAAGKFRTIQAAYAAAPAGTADRPTVIGIKPDVYLLQAPAGSPYSLDIRKDHLTFLGLTNNRRAVVLADNRGNRMGGGDGSGGSSNGYVVNVDATGFTARNLTFLNYCNVDYEYPGNPAKNLAKRSAVITQAVALQASGDRLVLENVALCSRLDTMFLRTVRSWFKDVFIEGTDDFIGGGGVSVWEDCRIVFPEGSGVMSAGNIAFLRCRFESAGGLQFYKAEYRGAERPVALLDCTLPAPAPGAPVAWVRGRAAPRPGLYSLTHRNRDPAGRPAVILDDTTGEPSFAYTRELSAEEARAFNPWNMLRATPTGAADDWDPAGARAKFEPPGRGSQVYRMTLKGAPASVRSGGAGATIGVTLAPARAADTSVTWSAATDLVTLSRTTGPDVVVTGNNPGAPAWVPVTATAANGFRVTAWVHVEPPYVAAPVLTRGPALGAPAGGRVAVDYAYDLAGREDQSLVTWYACDDAAGANPREVAVSRGLRPLTSYVLTPGDVGRFLRVGVQPKHNVSEPGPAVFAMAAAPVAVADLLTTTVSPDFRNFVLATDAGYTSGRWTLLGTWQAVAGERFVNGYGLRAASQGAQLLYQEDAARGDMRVDLVMSPEKTAGMGFGSPGGSADGDRIQKADIYIKFDPRTRNGYALRFWRSTDLARQCRFQFFRLVDGVGSPLDGRQAASGVLKPNTRLTLEVTGDRIRVRAGNDVDDETLELEGTIVPNEFGGAGLAWFGTTPPGNSNVISRFEISYPGLAAGK